MCGVSECVSTLCPVSFNVFQRRLDLSMPGEHPDEVEIHVCFIAEVRYSGVSESVSGV